MALKIFVENVEVGERVKAALQHAEFRKWYASVAQDVILFSKESQSNNELNIIAFDTRNVSHDADSEILFFKTGAYEVRISTVGTDFLQKQNFT